MDRHTTIQGNTVINGSNISTSTINNTNQAAPAVSPEMWTELVTLAGRYGSANEVSQALQLKQLLEEKRGTEAKPLWEKLRAFFGGVLQHSANLAQIIGTMDAVTKHPH